MLNCIRLWQLIRVEGGCNVRVHFSSVCIRYAFLKDLNFDDIKDPQWGLLVLAHTKKNSYPRQNDWYKESPEIEVFPNVQLEDNAHDENCLRPDCAHPSFCNPSFTDDEGPREGSKNAHTGRSSLIVNKWPVKGLPGMQQFREAPYRDMLNNWWSKHPAPVR